MKMEHYRICGYLFTIAMHFGNTAVTKVTPKDPDVMNDPDVKTMLSMETTFFTVWNIGFQLAYSTFGLYCDVKALLGNQRQSKKLSDYMQYRKTFFSAVLWPSTFFVFTAFWPLFTYDRSLVFPEFVDKVVSKTGNFIIHAGIVPVVLWEMAFLPVDVPKSHRRNVSIINSVFFIYLIWIFYTNAMKNLWPYPILTILQGTIYFPLFFAAAYAILITHYFLHWRLRHFVWRNRKCYKSY